MDGQNRRARAYNRSGYYARCFGYITYSVAHQSDYLDSNHETSLATAQACNLSYARIYDTHGLCARYSLPFLVVIQKRRLDAQVGLLVDFRY
jgi:hypothetical protein